MIVKTFNDLDDIRAKSASFDYADPKWIEASVVTVDLDNPRAKNRYAVVGKDSDGGTRVYGAVGGKWRCSPLMDQRKAKIVIAHLVKDAA